LEVAVASRSADELLGVRQGFVRYFQDVLERPTPVAVVPQESIRERRGLPLSDEETVAIARCRARALRDSLGDQYAFYVATSGGLDSIAVEGDERYFIRCWTVILGAVGEAWGGSGSQQIPTRLWEGLDGEKLPFAVPGKRRRGGMLSSLTGRLETRRSAVALSTTHALSTLFYGVLAARK
jgi:non-canonical (house-cleaning) NTP pyrophosphatase